MYRATHIRSHLVPRLHRLEMSNVHQGTKCATRMWDLLYMHERGMRFHHTFSHVLQGLHIIGNILYCIIYTCY